MGDEKLRALPKRFRTWKYKIEVDVNDEYYRGEVFKTLGAIERNPVGKVMLDLIVEMKGKMLRIEPMDNKELEKSNAEGRGAYLGRTYPARGKERHSAPKGVSERGVPDYWYRGDPDNLFTTHEDERKNKVPNLVGTGAGADTVIIEFSPELIEVGKLVWDQRPDNVLVHELVHALRAMQGLSNPVPTGDRDKDWQNEEEFWACVVQNMYLSASGSTHLRDGYGDYTSLLSAPLNTSSGFLSRYEALFRKHSVSWRQTYSRLGMVSTANFNPFRAFLGIGRKS